MPEGRRATYAAAIGAPPPPRSARPLGAAALAAERRASPPCGWGGVGRITGCSVNQPVADGAGRAGVGADEPRRVDHRRDARRELEDEPDGRALLGRGDCRTRGCGAVPLNRVWAASAFGGFAARSVVEHDETANRYRREYRSVLRLLQAFRARLERYLASSSMFPGAPPPRSAPRSSRSQVRRVAVGVEVRRE